MKMFVAIVATALVTASAPALADAVVNYARNSGKVDGFSAVGANSDRRARKLVATDREGFLPTDLVRPERCASGTNLGFAYVPKEIPLTDGYGEWIFQHDRFSGFNCSGGRIAVQHPAEGIYWVWFEDLADDAPSCPDCATPPLTALVTPVNAPAATATYRTGGRRNPDGESARVVEIFVYDFNDEHTDADLSVALLDT